VDVSAFGAASAFKVGAGAGLTVNHVAAGATLTISGAQSGTITVTGSDVTGTADTLNVVQTNATGGIVAAAGYETIALTSSIASGVLNINDAALKTLTIGGTKSINVTLNALDVLATTIDASGNSGGVTITSVSTLAASITGGSGNDVLIAKTGTTAETLSGGAGNDALTSNAGLDVLTGGAGYDTFTLGAVGASKNIYSTITDAAAGDSLVLKADQGLEVLTKTKLTLADTATFADYVDLAAAGDGSTNGAIKWFQFSGNTYVVEDVSASAFFVDGGDYVVKMTGLVDLSNGSLYGASGNIVLIA
jgi:S-layer protein